jgi:hypothetical protein
MPPGTTASTSPSALEFDDIEQNQFVVTQQFIVRAGKTEKRATWCC